MARRGGRLALQRVRYPRIACGIAFHTRVGATIFDQRNHAAIPEVDLRLHPRPDAWIRSVHAGSDSGTPLQAGRPFTTVSFQDAAGMLPDYGGIDFATAARDLAPFGWRHDVRRLAGRALRRVRG